MTENIQLLFLGDDIKRVASGDFDVMRACVRLMDSRIARSGYRASVIEGIMRDLPACAARILSEKANKNGHR